MKHLILFFAFLFPAVSFAQDAPTLFDEWSPALAGSLAHFRISKDEITITFPSHFDALATIITIPAPVTAPAGVVTKSDPIVSKTEKVKLLKVIFDSAKSKGRLFVRVDKMDSMILPLSFLLKDNGEAEIGLAVDPFTMMMGNMKTLKEAEKATRPNAKNKSKNFGMVLTHGEIDEFKNFTFTFYNSSRTAEFAKLKDPATMSKDEVIGMMNSFGDRLAAELQALPQDSATTNSFKMFSYIIPIFKNIQHIANDVFIAHGYNPLGAASCIEKFKGDSDVMIAGKLLGEKIEQSVPALREEKAKREIKKEAAIQTEIQELDRLFKLRTDVISHAIDTLRGSEGVDNAILTELITARSNAAALTLTPEIVKDSLAFDKFQKIQDNLSSAISNVSAMIEKSPALRSQEKFSVYLRFEIEKSEDRIGSECRSHNALLLYEMPAKSKYYSFTGKYAEQQSHNDIMMHSDDATMQQVDSMATPPPPDDLKAPPPPPPPIRMEEESIKDDFVDVATEPKALEQIKVDYPDEAKKAGIEGSVRYSVLIGKDGRPVKVSIGKSDNTIFNQAVIDAVMKTHYKPAMQNGKPVKVWVSQSISFKLNSDTSEPDQR